MKSDRWQSLAMLGLLLTLWGSVAVRAAEPLANPFVVVTYNIRYDNPGDGENVWTNRREAMVEYLRQSKADFVGMQEVLPQQRDYLAEKLTDYDWYSAGRDDGEKGEATPIFWRKDRYELQEQGTFWLSETPATPGSKGWDAALPRVVSWVKLKDKQAGKSILFVNTHFDHMGRKARLESAKLLVKQIGRLAGEGDASLPVVLTGDFNTTPKSEPYKVLVGGESDSAKLLDAQHISREPHTGGDSTSNGFKTIRPGAKIDHIFVRGLSVATHAIEDPRIEERFVSDHQPVRATIGW
ncbi:MAG: endonuclease/exonuclease/phosphatase family protein [Pirellulaceae bacterium]